MAPTLTEIRTAAKRLAEAHRASITRASTLETAIAAAITPIYQKHLAGIDAAAEEEAAARAELQAMIDVSPQLFSKPRSLSVDGVKCGYRKQEDSLDWDDEANVITRIRALPELVDLAPVLVRTEEALVITALAELDARTKTRIGIRLIPGIDQPFISFGDSDVEKMVKAILADAAKRQGEDDAPKKKGKAKVKEVA